MPGDSPAFLSVSSHGQLLESIDAIRTAELWIGPDCEILHRTGHGPRQAVRVLRDYCSTSEAHKLRSWLAANLGSDVANGLFVMLGEIAQELQEVRDAVVDLDNSNVQAVDFPDEDFWIGVLSIEEGWNCVRELAEAVRLLLDDLTTRLLGAHGD